MGLEKRTIKIIVIVSVVVMVIGGIIGLLLGLLLPQRYVELEVWPRSDEYNWYHPLIQVRGNDSWHNWYRRLNDFLRIYETARPENPPQVPCSVHRRDQQQRSDSCDMAMRQWGPCTADNFYGYDRGKPCIFLRLSHNFNWVPKPYNNTEELPSNMPADLKQHIKMVSGKPEANAVWVSCVGENPADVENIGPVQYFPHRSFPAYYYPFTNKNGYLSPLVAVLFEKPRTGVLINIECKAWAKNIFYDRNERRGSVHFELMVDRA